MKTVRLFMIILLFAISGVLLLLFNVRITEPLLPRQIHQGDSTVLAKLLYWKRKDHVPAKERTNRYLTWFPWEAGHNNRRMSLELAYTFAYLTNRTLVLPVPGGSQYPFPKPIYFEDIYDLEEMKKAVPTLTNQQFKDLPNYKAIIATQPAIVNWTDIPTQDSCVGWPRMPAKDTPEWERYVKWKHPRSPEGYWGHPHEPTQVPHFHTATVLHFPHHVLFTHFYLLFFFLEESPIQLPNITKLVKEHVHFRKDIMVAASHILKHFPAGFSTLHYRRDDLQFQDNRWIAPTTIFDNTFNLFRSNETIYVATDEKSDTFKDEFLSVFEKRYKIITAKNFPQLNDLPKEWVPLVEMLFLSQGRVFVGTRQSTFSGYVTRLRGYMKSVLVKDIYWTIKKYPDDYINLQDLWKGWEREYPEAWESVED